MAAPLQFPIPAALVFSPRFMPTLVRADISAPVAHKRRVQPLCARWVQATDGGLVCVWYRAGDADDPAC